MSLTFIHLKAMKLLELSDSPSWQLTILEWIDNAEQTLFGLPPFQGDRNEIEITQLFSLTLT